MVIRDGLVAIKGEDEFKKISIIIEDGKIKELTDTIPLDDEIIDAEGLYVLPGGIDAHVHFNTPGFEIREDFYHGSCFAASGGITTVIDMPCTSLPPVTSLANLKTKLEVVKQQSVIDYLFYGGVNGKDLSDFRIKMKELAPYVAGFKCYLKSGMESFGSVTYAELREILLMSSELGLPILLHAEDEAYIVAAESEQRKLGSGVDNYYYSRPEAAEIIAVSRAAIMAEETGGDLHIVHISTGEAAEIAVKHGVSVETCPHYLAFCLEDFRKQGSVLKVAPVIKRHEQENLWSQVADDTISFVTSDHAASRIQDKNTGSIWSDYGGISGSGLLLPYLFSEGYMTQRISIKRLLEIVCENPAKRYGIANIKGRIAEGYDADLVLIDPHQEQMISGADFLSKGRMTPFEGKEFKCKIIKTIRRGEIVYDFNKGITSEAGSGKMLRVQGGRNELLD
ncbi:MAG: amidohydrolase family protein [Candidatus Stygibacter frigidus]|nr:amidohydrolase family protein [Candidatus Stygibacter frigidus]